MTVGLSENKMEEFRKKATDELQDKVKVPGFRAGKIPMEQLIKNMGEQAFMGHVLDLAVSKSYEEVIKREKLQPVSYPKLQITEQSPLKYEATVSVLPEVKWKKDINGLTVSPAKVEVTEAEMKEVLKNLKKRSTRWKDVDRAAKKGDRTEIDFEGSDKDGVSLEGTKSQNHPVILGEGSLIPGFEEEVVGMKKDEEKDFEITFPKDYQAEHFQNKKVKFHIKLNRVEEPEEPELNDEFVEEITGGNRKTVKELKDEIREELSHQKGHQEEAKTENEFLKKLAEYVDAEIPEAMIERETDFLVNRIKEDLEKRKVNFEDYEKEMREKGKDIRAELKTTAEEQVRVRLGLEKLLGEEKIEVSDADVEAEVGHMLGHYPPEFAEVVKEQYKEGSPAREQIKNKLVLSKLVKRHTKK